MKLARLFVLIGGLVVLLLVAALVAPYFIDWANYRADFERQAGHVLGREVRVEGAARARLLPFPSVTFSDVVVAGSDPQEPAMTVEEFSMDAELAPFLRGELLIFDMRLIRPHVRIRIDDAGRIDWTARPSSPFDPGQVSLERLTITEGRITVDQHAGKRSIVLDDINSEMSARSLAGPWRLQGSLNMDGLPVALSGSTGTAGADGIRVRISARPDELPFSLEVDGQASIGDRAAQYAGNFDLRSMMAADEDQPAPAVAGNRVTGRFSLDHESLSIEEFRLAAGSADNPYTADGHAEIAFGADPFFSIVADGAQIRWDGSIDETDTSQITAVERLSAFTSFISSLPKPSMPGAVAVNLPAIVAGDTTVRDIRIQAEPAAEGWRIGSVAATLPGRTRFEGSGLLTVDEDVSFAGHILLAIAQPSGFASWVARDVDDAIRRLPAAGFSADATLSSSQQTFENLELILGDAKFAGRVERQSPADRRAALLVSLDGGRLDVDGLRAFASLFVDEQGQNRLANHDVDVEFAAGPVMSQGVEADRIETALRLREQVLEIDRFSATGLADANVSATGRIENLSADPAGNIDATIVAVDLAPLVNLVATRFPGRWPFEALARNASAYPGLLEDAAIDVLASYSSDRSTEISVKGNAGGTRLSLAGNAGDFTLSEDMQVEAHLTARNAEAANLYALFGLPALPLGLAGEATMDAQFSGSLGDGVTTRIAVGGEGLSARFDGAVTRNDNQIDSRGEIELAADDLEPWLSAAGIALPGFGYGLPAEVKATIDMSEQLAVISNLTGNVADSDLYGDLNAELRNGIPHVTGSLYIETLDFALPLEMVTGSEALQMVTETWPEVSFQRGISTPFTADIELTSDRIWLAERTLAESARMQFRLDSERLALSGISANVLGGRIEGLAELRNDEGTGLLSAQFSLKDAPLGELLPQSGFAAGTADVSATVGATGKSVNALVASLSGSGSAAISDFAVSGLDPRAFQALISKADEFGPEIDASRVETFAPAIVQDGIFSTGPAELAFTVANGVARFPPLQLAGEGARMSVDGATDFRDQTVSASGRMTYEAGDDAVSGAEPMVRFNVSGPLAALDVALDTEPLTQFLTQRALEREQQRVEHMQAVLLETQRLRREMRYFEQQAAIRASEEAERIRLEREAERSHKAAAEEKRKQEAERRTQQERERLRQMQPPVPRPPAVPLLVPESPDPILNFDNNPGPARGAISREENHRRLQEMFSPR